MANSLSEQERDLPIPMTLRVAYLKGRRGALQDMILEMEGCRDVEVWLGKAKAALQTLSGQLSTYKGKQP